MWKACRRWLASVPSRPHQHHLPPLTQRTLQPQRRRQQQQQRRRAAPAAVTAKVSVLDALERAPGLPSSEGEPHRYSDSLVASDPAPSDSPYLQPSAFAPAFQRHRRQLAPVEATSRSSAFSPPSPSASSSPLQSDGSLGGSLEEMRAQQAALREAYAYADRHHRLRMRKDRGVYAAEARAFKTANGGRQPTEQEVSRYTDVSLPPVTALKALAHLDPRTSPAYKDVQEGLLLSQSITRSELMKSNERTLVRCLSCFHVYGARPRALWGGEDGSAHGGSGQQSWIALERERQRRDAAEQLMKAPKLRKRLYSVGRQRQREASSPTRCPLCGSPRAQWAMEYVHSRTHAK